VAPGTRVIVVASSVGGLTAELLARRHPERVAALVFLDAGNNYRSAAQYDPTRLFRGAGAGVAVVSPLGPIGVDMAYGFDRTDLAGRPKPGWQLHFRVGNFF